MTISTFFGMQTSLRGLLAQQRSIDVTSHNIANVNTVGYSRQEAVLSSSTPLTLEAGLQNGSPAKLGTGVEVSQYRRIRDQFLDIQYRAQGSNLGAAQTTAEGLSRVEDSLAEPSDNGLNAEITRFWGSWSALVNNPSNPATRTDVVEKSKALADSFGNLDHQLSLVQGQLSAEYDAHAGAGGTVDAIVKQLGTLNGTIQGMVSAGGTPNDLLDQRDVLLDQLAEYGNVSVEDGGDGSINVSFGDAATEVVAGTTVTWPQTLTNPGGKLGALRDMSKPGGTIDGYRSELNATVKTIADQVNALHTSGGGPAFFSYTAGAEAGSLTVSATAATLQTTTTGTAGANDLALKIAALVGGAGDKSYNALITKIGQQSAAATTGAGNASVLSNSIEDRRQSTSGVSLDEEMTNLLKFQRAYQASSRAMSTMDDMLDVLINRTGRVGL